MLQESLHFEAILRAVIYGSLALIVYTYAGYPLLLAALAVTKRKTTRKGNARPRVTVVIAAWNEVNRIKERVNNCLKQDYPESLLDVVVVSDGSTDGTVQEARSVGSPRVHVVPIETRMGKAQALNAGVALSRGEVIVFADARQSFAQDAVRQLIENFFDPNVGAVTGELVFEDQEASCSCSHSGGLYWKIEKWIRRNEGDVDSVIGATGAIYAIRKSLFVPFPPNTILDDLLLPMRITMRGYRVVFEPQAIAIDSVTNDYRNEFSRKVRTLAGNYQAVSLYPDLLMPWRNRLFFQFLSHKMLRLISPLFLLLLLIANIGMRKGWMQVLLVMQVIGYGTALLGWLLRLFGVQERWTGPAFTFCLLNCASLCAGFQFARAETIPWSKASSYR